MLRMLMERQREYFDKRGALNSEGMKLMSRLAREALKERPWLRGVIKEVMRKRSYESVVKLKEIMEEPI